MTERMLKAGIAALVSNDGEDPEDVVSAIYDAVFDEQQKEALEKYWSYYDK